MKFAVSALLLLGACGNSAPTPAPRPAPQPDARPALIDGKPRSARLASYEITAALDAAARQITARQTLTWTNSGTDPVAMLPFHLYMNAFKNDESLFMRSSGGEHRGERASTTHWGWIEVTAIRVDGGADRRAASHFAEPDETVLEVPLERAVEPGASVRVEMEFTVQLPEVFARTGYKGDFIMVGQWFPKIGVRIGGAADAVKERWHCEPMHVNTEFFADFGTYDVVLTVPTTHVIAASGVLTSAVDNADATRTLTYRAEDVHDFAWMADPFMEIVSGTATNELGDVEVRVYHRPGQAAFARRHLRAGIAAIETFSKLYVPYPWAIMSIIDPPDAAAGSAGGMEYPTLVTTAGDIGAFGDGVRLGEYVTVHEVGHNWFQGILASNEVEEAWMDEGVNEYADSIAMDELFGTRANLLDWFGYSADTLQVRRIADLAALPAPIATRAPLFPDSTAYSDATYAKTGLALRTLENIVGVEPFRAAMRAYAREWAFRHPTGADLWRSLERSLATDLRWFIDPVFYGRGVVDLRVRKTSCRVVRVATGVFGTGPERHTVEEASADSEQYVCDVVISNLGDVPVPVDIELVFADGQRVRERWGGGQWHTLTTEHVAPLAEVHLDPERAILIDTTLLENSVRLGSSTASTRAAGARAQFWTQTAMQWSGL